MARPFIREQFTFRQPDGSTIEVRGTGNQYEARFETLDGRPIAQDPTSGFFHYVDPSSGPHLLRTVGIRAGIAAAIGLDDGVAPPDSGDELPPTKGFLDRSPSRWEQRRARARMARELSRTAGVQFAPPQRPTVGQFTGLTLLIEFPDVPATIDRAEVEAYCNKEGYSGFGNNGSVRDYFLAVSDGKLDYRNIVAPYYKAKQPRAYYTNEMIPQPIRAIELIYEALEHHLGAGFDVSALTADDQDFVYALNIFYVGPKKNNWAKGLWPHSHHLDNPYPLPGGKQLYDYQFTNMGSELTLGTFCHENGHMICDFPDLYDYGYQSNGVGVWCLMCGGGSGANEKNPGQVGAYLKHAAGWTSDVTQVAAGSTVNLKAGRNEFALHRLNDTEYYIIENRQPAGRDAGLPGGGLAVWHVDELGDNQNEQMTPAKHYECSLIQADGRNDLEKKFGDGDAGDLFHGGGNTTFGATTKPPFKWWDGQGTGVTISNVSNAADSMSFKVT